MVQEEKVQEEKFHQMQTSEQILEHLRTEILPLFDRAITDDNVVFKNPNLIDCWQEKTCTREECPSFNKLGLRCWQISGTYCGGKTQGAFVDKYDNCKSCNVFKDACPTIVEELGEHFNNLLFLIRKQKKQDKIQRQSIDHLNKELRSALENLQTRNMEIQTLVITDKLTGLYNRHYLSTVMEDEVIRCSRKEYQFSILMIDVDNFKTLNDNYGHLFGDKVLSELGRLIKNNIRNYDKAFRFGGEEFVVILPETDQTIAWMVAERIRESFAQNTFTVTTSESIEKKINRTLSIGIASYDEGLSVDDLVKYADMAMYTAKSQGKNRVVRSSEISIH